MEIIKYNELKDRKKILLSVSIFKMLRTYRKFYNYFEYLSIIINLYASNTHIDIRVYFDDSCLSELNSFIKKYKNVEFYKFNYQQLRIDKYHEGTFGSFIRFLPIHENEYEFVWISDLEPYKFFLDNNLLIKINNNEINTIFYSKPYYGTPWIDKNNDYPIINMFIITNQKIPIEIFNTYLTDLASNKYNEIKKKLMKYRQSYYHNLDIIDKFPYGMDEYYSNNIIYNYLYTKKTWVIYDVNPILLIKKIKNNTELIKMMYDLCNDLYKTNDQQIIKNMIDTIKSLIKKVGEVTLLNYFESYSKEQTSLKYIIDLLTKENINTNSFDQIKQIK
jgi:hypothetical protein